jgi:1-acyl-sn-glycerol-3-phosphate acyltransferase
MSRWDRLSSLLDGFEPGSQTQLDGYDEDFIDRHSTKLRFVKDHYFRFTIEGFEHIPDRGGALLILNHGLFSIDPYFLGVELWTRKRRLLRALTDRRSYMIPYVRELYRKIGVVEGDREAAIALLKQDEICFAMPGGGLEWGKPSSEKYELVWEDHMGFVITALRGGAPIIPVVTVGIDDVYTIPISVRVRALGAKARLPLFVHGWGWLPRPVKLTQYIGAPIRFDEMGYVEKDAESPQVVRELQVHVKGVMTGMLQAGLARRASRWS